jgi:hypothetical protein
VQHQVDLRSIHVAPLTREPAEDIATWRYAAPYDVYDMVGTDSADLLRPEVAFNAVLAATA